ncbi:class I SAM-dependent methyltransferase [Xanthobacteraceae bacterium A53D]
MSKPTVPKAPKPRHRAIDLVWERAYQEAADFIQQHTATAMIFDRKLDLHRFAFRDLSTDGLILEFGVSTGGSINRFADMLSGLGDPRPIYGFDAFSGLSEDWVGHAYPKLERFDLKGKLPTVRDNVTLVQGWVDDTLPDFLAKHEGAIAFLHVDTDTYGPARTTLELCRNRLKAGSVILFDELIGYPGWQHGEHKALLETLPEDSYDYVGFSGFEAMVRLNRTP